MKLKFILLTVFAFTFAWTTNAQEKKEAEKGKLTLNGLFRTIGEYRDGYGAPLKGEGEVPSTVFRSRLRLSLGYKKAKFSSKITLQDVRAWGSQFLIKEAEKSSENIPVHVYEAWAQYKFNDALGLRVGRQTLSYNDGRLLWERRWRDQGLSHDAAVLRYEKNETKLHVGFSKSSNSMTKNAVEQGSSSGWIGVTYDSNYNYHKHLAYVHYSTKLAKGLNLSLMDIFITRQGATKAEDVYGLNTVGFDLRYKSDGLFGSAELFHQHGTNNKNGKNVSALMYSASLGYKIDKVTMKLGYDFYQGETDDSDDYTAFDPLYHGAHRFLGRIDFFILPTWKKGANDIFFELGLNANKKTSFTATYHYIMSDSKIMNGEEELSKGLSSGVDLSMKYKFAKNMMFRAGWSFALPTETYKHFKYKDTEAETRFANWGWIMLVFKPNFLN